MRLIIKYVFIIFVLFGSGHLSAQNGGNPFELKHRQTVPIISSEEAEEEIDTRIIKTDNPFDVLEQPTIIANPVPTEKTNTKSVEESSDSSKNYLVWVFLFLLLFFTSVVSLSRQRLEQSYKSFLNDNFARQSHRSNQGSFSLAYALLYLLFLLNAGIFIFFLTQYYNLEIPGNFKYLVLFCLATGLVFIGKHFLLFLVGNIFPIDKEIKLYSFTIMIFSIILGIVLLPLNILIAFAPVGLTKMFVWGGLGAILAFYIFRSLRGLAIGSKYLMLHKFHFLLYLCAIEILPIIILLKFSLKGIN